MKNLSHKEKLEAALLVAIRLRKKLEDILRHNIELEGTLLSRLARLRVGNDRQVNVADLALAIYDTKKEFGYRQDFLRNQAIKVYSRGNVYSPGSEGNPKLDRLN